MEVLVMKWFYAKFDSPEEVAEFANRNNLKPTEIVALANSTLPGVGMVWLTHVMYYAKNELT